MLSNDLITFGSNDTVKIHCVICIKLIGEHADETSHTGTINWATPC